MPSRTKTLPILHEKIIILGIGLLFLVGLFLHHSTQLYPITLKITDFFLFGTNSLVLIFTLKKTKDLNILYWFLGTWIFTFIIEVVGVHTGVIFGDYAYGPVLWVQYKQVPIIIGQNWAILILAGYALTSRFFKKGWQVIWSTAAIIVLFDIILEPVAVDLNYWTWTGGTIPLQNYVAWFLLAALLTFLLRILKVTIRSTLLPVYLGIQAVFFLMLRWL